MVFKINKDTSVEEFNRVLSSLQPHKAKFRSEMFLGKVKWGEDALEYQKKMRDEWE